VACWGVIHVRGKSSGLEMEVPSAGVFEFRDGLIVRWQDVGSKEKALAAATVDDVPPPT
jgi:hypothetical protein